MDDFQEHQTNQRDIFIPKTMKNKNYKPHNVNKISLSQLSK